MGSWNGTCGITQTPITSGTKVKAVIIKNKSVFPEASGFCYNAGYADLFSFVFSGEYDDYGSIENIIEDASTRTFMEWFRENLSMGKIEIAPDRREDNGDYSNITFAGLINIMERDRLFYNDSVFFYNEDEENVNKRQGYNKVKVNIGFMMVHESVFNKVSNSLFKDSGYDRFLEKDLVQDCTYAYNELITQGDKSEYSDEALDIINKKLQSIADKDSTEYKELQSLLLKLTRLNFGRNNSWDDQISKTGEYGNMVRIFRGNEGSDSKIFSDFLRILQNNNDTAEDVVDVLKNTILLIRIMNTLRKPWMAQSGKGSQSFDEDTIIALSEAIKEVAYNDREDLTDYELDCIGDFTEYYAGSGYNFKEGTVYICQKMEEDSLLMGNGCWISYQQFKQYFEY